MEKYNAFSLIIYVGTIYGGKAFLKNSFTSLSSISSLYLFSNTKWINVIEELLERTNEWAINYMSL